MIPIEDSAIHEAGHAAMTILLGGSVPSVYVSAGGGGMASNDGLTEMGRAAVAIAGALAAAKAGCAGVAASASDGDKKNFALAIRAAGGDQEANMDAAIEGASKVLDEHWDFVSRLAKAILRKRSMTHAEVREVYDQPSVTHVHYFL